MMSGNTMDITIESIWDSYHNNLLLFIKKRVADHSTAEDILQDVFIKILSNIKSLKDNSKIKSWLYQITRNTIIDHYRSNRKLQELPLSLAQREEEREEGKEEDEIGRCMLPMINQLPEKYRDALLLSEIKGLSQKEVATTLNISYPNAKIRVQRGRKMLKASLTDCCSFNVDKYGKIIDYKEKNGDCKDTCG